MREHESWGAVPYERMIAVLRYRGLDAEAMRVAQERQLATLREAAEMLSKTMQEIGNRQAELLRETMERMAGSFPGASGDGSVTDLTHRQVEASRQQVEASVDAFRAIAGLMWDCGRNAFELMNRTMAEHMQAIGNADLDVAREIGLPQQREPATPAVPRASRRTA